MHHKAAPIIAPMDLTTLDYIRILIGVAILLYVANCLVNQKVWIRKTFSWGAREEYPRIFQMNIIGGSLLGHFWLQVLSCSDIFPRERDMLLFFVACKGNLSRSPKPYEIQNQKRPRNSYGDNLTKILQ